MSRRQGWRAWRPVRWIRIGLIGGQLLGWFLLELLSANLAQARLILRWRLDVRPRWIHYETELSSSTARTLLGVLISLTPGTLTCDLNGNTLLIHALDVESEREVTERIRLRFESLLVRMENS